MKENNIPPEEKLLSLIRGDKKVSKGNKEPVLPVEKKIKNLRKIFFPLGKVYPEKFKVSIRPLLIFIIILLSGVIVYECRRGVNIKSRIDFIEERKREKKESSPEPVSLKPYSYYAEEIGKKSLFKPLIIEKQTTNMVRSGKIEDISKRYQVKGIIVGERPEAFIEDTQSRRTFTVTIGDSIDNIQVKDIKEGRVILGYEDETYDLFF